VENAIQTNGNGNWLGEVAHLGLGHLKRFGEVAIVFMDGKGRAWVHEKTYGSRRVAAGQATRMENASRGEGFLRCYLVSKYGELLFVHSAENTILWHGKAS